jgi:peptidoglycan/xylan/chitin deacetylase (PgdA/CDA1 family)
MRRSARRALVCAFAVGCLPVTVLSPGAAPAEIAQGLLSAVPVRLGTGTAGIHAPPATRPAARPAARRRATRPVDSRIPQVPITAFPAHGRSITLSFDDGPDPRWTPTVLDLLRQYHAHAIFCMVGLHAAAHPDLVRRAVREGHALCDHTWTHDEHLERRPATVIEQEVGGTARLLTQIGGVAPRYYRAPGGNWTAGVIAVARAHGLAPLGWAVDPGDWAQPGTGAIIERVLAGARPGAVVLMHDGYGERAQNVAALRVILATLTARGYRFTLPA